MQTYAQRNGIGEEKSTQLISQLRSDTHTAVINRLLSNGEDLKAEQYFKAAKANGEIAGDDITELEVKLEVATTEGQALRAAGEIWAALGPKNDKDPTHLDKMRDQAEALFKDRPKAYKATMEYIRERALLHNAASKERNDEFGAAVWKAYGEKQPLSQIKRMQEFRDMPPEQATKFENYVRAEENQKSNEAFTRGQHARTLRDQAQEDREKSMDAAYWEYSKPSTLAAMSDAAVYALGPTLGKRNVNALMNQKRNIEEVRDKDNSLALSAAKIDDDMFNQLAHRSGLRPYVSNKSEDERAALGAMKKRVEELIGISQRIKNRKLFPEEKEELMLKEMDRRVMVDDWGSNSEVHPSMVSEDDLDDVYVPLQVARTKYPKALKNFINIIRSSGRLSDGVTDEQVVELYQDRIEKAIGQSEVGVPDAKIIELLTK